MAFSAEGPLLGPLRPQLQTTATTSRTKSFDKSLPTIEGRARLEPYSFMSFWFPCPFTIPQPFIALVCALVEQAHRSYILDRQRGTTLGPCQHERAFRSEKLSTLTVRDDTDGINHLRLRFKLCRRNDADTVSPEPQDDAGPTRSPRAHRVVCWPSVAWSRRSTR